MVAGRVSRSAVWGAGLCFIVALGPVGRAADVRTRPPNILFCIADDASYQHFSAYGCRWVNTPAFDRLAQEGILFNRAYTPNAKCAPSRAIVLTGRNSWQLESAANHGGYYPKGYRTFMEALGQHGYFVGFTGKPWAPGDPGTIDGRPRELCGPAYNKIKTTPPTSEISPIDYAANFAEFLQRRPAGQPFCFWYGSHEPHRPYAFGSGVKLAKKSPAQIDRVPPYWPDTDAVRNDMLDYALEVEYFDRQLGLILDLLAKSGEQENTIVVVTSDNGMPFPRSKGATYEISMHMPLAVRWPVGVVHPGRKVDDYVSFADFAPTFMAMAGLSATEAGMEPMSGLSLLNILRDAQPGRIEAGRESLLLGQERHDVGRPDDVGYPVRGIFADGFLFLHNFEPARWPMCDPISGYLNTDGSPTKTAVLDENRHGVNHWRWELDFGRRPLDELYDLARDPDCMANLATVPGQAVRLEQMRQRLFAALRAQHDPRIEGKGAVFDQYPNAGPAHDFYTRRILHGEKVSANWANESDFESPDFDPERPLANRK